LSSCTFSIFPPLSSYHSLAVDVHSTSFHLRIVNFYHHILSHTHSLDPLFLLPISDSIPTIIAGDFNTHSLFWTPPPHSISPWAPILEEWIDTHSLSLTIPEGAVTWQNNRSHSLIDLLLVNPALLDLPLSPLLCDVSFSLSFGSDHAGLLYSFHLPQPVTAA
jgi:endonuclease/exonuclease/phosphatase family metal-dependent hydrolase